MEIDLKDLEALFESATVTCDYPGLKQHEFSLQTFVTCEGLAISVRDENYRDLLTISIPAKSKTTLSF